MIKFHEGDRVVFKKGVATISEGQLFLSGEGIVKKAFDNLPYVIATFDDRTLKIPDFALEKVTPKPDVKEKVEITREDFHDLAIKFTSIRFLEDLFEDEEVDIEGLLEFAATAGIIIDNLENMIFGEKE